MSTEPIVFVHTHHLFDLCLIYIFILLITCHPVPLHGAASGGWGVYFRKPLSGYYTVVRWKQKSLPEGIWRHNSTLPAFKFTKYSLRWKMENHPTTLCYLSRIISGEKENFEDPEWTIFLSVDLGKQFLGFSCYCKIFFLIKENTLENNNLTLCVLTLFSLSVSHFPELCLSCPVPCLVQALYDPTQTNRFIHRTRTPLNLN